MNVKFLQSAISILRQCYFPLVTIKFGLSNGENAVTLQIKPDGFELFDSPGHSETRSIDAYDMVAHRIGQIFIEKQLQAAKQAAIKEIDNIEGLLGVGLGDNTVRLYVLDESVYDKLPGSFVGVPVEVVITGEIVSL